jgi:thiamine kinase-like enzyme
MRRVEEMVERVWPGRRAQIEVLGGGITNRNFKVTLDDGAYVLRIGGKDTELLGIDRRVEHEASLAAAAVGVGPEVVAFVEPEGYLVTRFIEGEVVLPESIRAPEPLRRIAGSLRAVHAGPPIRARFDPFRVVEAYAATAATNGVAVPDAFERCREIAARVERARGPVPERPCHNDLLTANFIDDGSRIRIVDWEYAGMGDVFFDLANFAVNNGLSGGDSEELLRAYFGEVRRQDQRALTLMRFMSDFREAMWGVVQQALSDLEFDFRAYAAEHFERLERIASERAFRRALT